MSMIHIRILSVTTLALLVSTGSTAQGPSSAVLNSLEVQQLVNRAEPGDHSRLAGHFSALAERYAAEAMRHTSMAQTPVGNPSRNLGIGMSAHCKRLADLNTQSATQLRELAAYHQDLASGVAATPPTAAAHFERGAGASVPTNQEVNEMAASARTPAEHRALEEYLLTAAKRYTADAKAHIALANAYRGTRIAQAAVHCDRLAAVAKDAAKEATEAAAMHKQLAGMPR